MDAEQPPGFQLVSKHRWVNERVDVEVVAKPILRQRIGVHRHDVLKPFRLGLVGSELQRLRDLPLVDTVEQVAVMDQRKPGPRPRRDASVASITSKQNICMLLMPLLRWESIVTSNVGPLGVAAIVRLPARS